MTVSGTIFFSLKTSLLFPWVRPFDPQLYEDETEDDAELLDEDGRTRLKLKVGSKKSNFLLVYPF